MTVVWAMTIEQSTMTAPTERSMPAVRMMSVWASARVPTTATCWVMSDRFDGFEEPVVEAAEDDHGEDEHDGRG